MLQKWLAKDPHFGALEPALELCFPFESADVIDDTTSPGVCEDSTYSQLVIISPQIIEAYIQVSRTCSCYTNLSCLLTGLSWLLVKLSLLTTMEDT